MKARRAASVGSEMDTMKPARRAGRRDDGSTSFASVMPWPAPNTSPSAPGRSVMSTVDPRRRATAPTMTSSESATSRAPTAETTKASIQPSARTAEAPPKLPASARRAAAPCSRRALSSRGPNCRPEALDALHKSHESWQTWRMNVCDWEPSLVHRPALTACAQPCNPPGLPAMPIASSWSAHRTVHTPHVNGHAVRMASPMLWPLTRALLSHRTMAEAHDV
mmetsp:Transcript_24478/g.49071  ORF Transcript_24478/g.49071 Transcript_24478/m.49071 type:complete len:222 (-) Transcript_24478:902-1567(-)